MGSIASLTKAMNDEDEYLLVRWKRMHQDQASKKLQALFDVTQPRASQLLNHPKLLPIQRKLLIIYFGLPPSLRDAFFPEVK